MGKRQKRNNAAEERGGNLAPFLIMLATVAVVAVPLLWTSYANPANRFNAHLNRAVKIYESAHNSVLGGGGKADPLLAAEAYREFATALRYGERAFGPEDPRLEDVLLAMLIFSIDNQQWPEAKRHGERLLKMQQARYPAKDRRFAATHGHLARVYRELGETEAEEQALRALILLDAGSSARRQLAQFYRRHGRHADALPLYRQVVSGDMIAVAEAEKSKQQARYRKSLETAAADTDEYLKTLAALKKTDEYHTVSKSRAKILQKLEEMPASK